MKKNATNREYNRLFFETVPPIKLTECGRLKLHLQSWGLLSDYVLESVKITRYKPKEVLSTAVLQVADTSGQVTCVIKGKTIGLLFGLTSEEWSDIEDMCDCGQQLFYRQFKKGLSPNFRCEQKLFYNFCHSNQKGDVFVAIFSRTVNNRNRNKHEPLINILHLSALMGGILDLYVDCLKKLQPPSNSSSLSMNKSKES